jgi:hypothetical protein
MQLTVMPVAGQGVARCRETWRRTFDGKLMVSTQRKHSPGLLLERVGAMELLLRLEVVDGELKYSTQRATVCLGIVRIPLPRWLPPQVSARETGVGQSQVHVAVEARLPWAGLLVAYEGVVTLREANPAIK